MNYLEKGIATPTIDFDHTAFNLLMQKRIRQVLLICSNYDSYMLEEDGRIDEQIFKEYASLNLRYPPVFIQASSARDAFSILDKQQIDLVIEMLNIEDIDTFELAKQIKTRHPGIPIVTLTHFSREVSMRLQNEDLSAIDYVFCWLGNADLLLAIIKLIEDRMNADYDVDKIGVQTILLVEDSIRYISSYLPNLYKIILTQSREFGKEALNEHQRMLRMRGRPKILLARTFDDAIDVFKRYKSNMLGVISDVTFKKNMNQGQKEDKMGVDFCRIVRSEDEFMPFLMQSSNGENEKYAKELGTGFLHKYSKNLSHELNTYIIDNFAFGDFIFRDPKTLEEIGRAGDLQSLQHKLIEIPENVLQFHSSTNDFSKWLKARAIFPVAEMFKYLRLEDFNSPEEMRHYLVESISNFRRSKGRGVIAQFDRKKYHEYLVFSRIGEGSIGGKARGLAFINSIIEKHQIFSKYPHVVITIPRTLVICTDVFDEFMEGNDLYKLALSECSDEVILQGFVQAELPDWLYEDLRAFIEIIGAPIAVRSSSKLEDSTFQPFAGVYSTYMVPLEKDKAKMMKMISDGIKSVYASVYFKNSKAYVTATSNVIDEEKMGIILQEVCGNEYGNKYYPTLSGVGRSINFYPIAPEKPEDGIASIAYGLGKYLMEGGIGLRFSPAYPKKILQLSSPEMVLKDTQKHFFALDLCSERFIASVDDGINILNLPFREAENDGSFRFAASTYDMQNNMIRDGLQEKGKRVVTFSNVLNFDVFPIAEIISTLLQIGQKEMNSPIEIEFAANLDTPEGHPIIFNFLQIRPIVINDQSFNFNLDEVKKENAVVISESALGNGVFTELSDLIYVKPETFNAADSEKIARSVGKLNEEFIVEEKNYVLIGPGRWGSSDPWLGIPIKWAQISAARVIVESGLENYRIDPSQGTHFFQNLTSFRVGYFTVNPFLGDGFFDLNFLNAQPAAYEDKYIRHIRFQEALQIKVDGRTNRGIIFKPGG